MHNSFCIFDSVIMFRIEYKIIAEQLQEIEYISNEESMIYDSKGNVLWLGNYETKGDRQSRSVTDLPFENGGDVQINVNIRISVNKDGVFQGVMLKGKNGKESMISIGDWNKKFKSDDDK